jgi:hypothetical protein
VVVVRDGAGGEDARAGGVRATVTATPRRRLSGERSPGSVPDERDERRKRILSASVRGDATTSGPDLPGRRSAEAKQAAERGAESGAHGTLAREGV